MTTKTDTTRSLRLERIIRTTPERVFAAWTRPELMRAWHAPEGVLVAEVEVDARVGGDWTVTMQEPEGGDRWVVTGTYRELTPPRRLVSTWAWLDEDGGRGPETILTVELRAEGDATRLVLTHEGFESDDSRGGHTEGWESSLNRLERHFDPDPGGTR